MKDTTSNGVNVEQTTPGEPQQNPDYQPVVLRFASLPALSSLESKTKLA